jgi:phage terminase large subunit
LQGIEVKLSEEQTQAFDYLEDDETNLVLYGGAAGGGKSFLISLWQIVRRLQMPGTRGYIAREQGLKKIEESILVTFMDVAKALNVSSKLKYNGGKNRIEFTNGSIITLIDAFYYPSDPNFDRLGSTEYTDGAIEEGITIHKKAQQVLLSRTRYKHNEFNIIAKQLITCNPGDGFLREEVVIPAMEGRLRPEYKFIQSFLDSNPNKEFVDSYKSTLKLMDDYDRSRLLHGDWFAQPKTGGEFYKKFDEARNVKKTTYDNTKALHITFDFNVNPYMTCCVWQIDGLNAYQINEICLKTPRNTTADTCKEFAAQYFNHEAGLFIYGDPAGKHEDTRSEKGFNDYTIIERELKSFKPERRVSSSAPSVVMRGRFINAVFAGEIEGLSLTISDKCTNTIADYNFVKESAEGTKAKNKTRDTMTKVSFEKYGHTSDANDYFIIFAFKAQFDTFVKGKEKPVYSYSGRKIKHGF